MVNSLADKVQFGREFAVRVTTRAAKNAVMTDGTIIRVNVTALPKDGEANRAVQKLLAKELRVAKSQIELVKGTKSRDKVFRLIQK